MSNWKVSKEKIELFNHPNADSLMIGKVGSYQVIVQKGLYNDGDEVIFAPEKSVLSGDIKTEFEKYLSGKEKNRVKGVRLRGEISSGIIIPKHLVPDFDSYEVGSDISKELDIQKYEPPIPQELAGKVKPFEMPFVGKHDCEQYAVYTNELIPEERVIITEKIHGSLVTIAHNLYNDETIVSSKGMLKQGLTLEESDTNTYWVASKNSDIVGKIKSNFSKDKNTVVQVFGEVVPIQGGYSYGADKPIVKVYDIRVDGVGIPFDEVPNDFKDMWVPVVFDGILELEQKEIVLYEDKEKGIRKTKMDYKLPTSIIDLSKGKELVSGRELHIREGVVLRPYTDRWAKDGTKLVLKIINPAYKETGEELN